MEDVLRAENEQATSERLANAWRVVGKRLLNEGYDPALVTETVLGVALKSWVGLRTPEDAVAPGGSTGADQQADLPPESRKRY